MDRQSISGFWLLASSLTLSFGWLLPNNSPPWLSFHKDAWVAVILAAMALFILWPRNKTSDLYSLPAVVAVMALMPAVQHFLGLVPVFGVAWIHSIYLLGFAVALQTGITWESQSRGQVADFVFLAMGIGALASSAIAIYQWLGLRTAASEWILGSMISNRYYANLAQPNLLGSFLLVGVVACAWAHWRQKLRGWSACLVAAFLLFGVVLTGSRTAFLNILILTILGLVWRRYLPTRQYIWAIIGLGIFTALCTASMPNLNQFLGISEEQIPIEYRALRDVRLEAWSMLFDAALEQPWFGFGWGHVGAANLSVLGRYPEQGAIFAHSHNVILDLILWNGFPLGLAISVFCGVWVVRLFRHATRFDQRIMIVMLVVLGTHAMLEFPLQYAYFLLPLGLVLGSLVASSAIKPMLQISSWVNLAVSVIAVLALAITIRDYFRVETSMYGLRFEDRGIPSTIPKTPPEVLVLTQFHESIKFARNVPRAGLSTEELNAMRDIVMVMPSALTIHKLAANLALNGREEEAVEWLRLGCKSSLPALCQMMERRWEILTKTFPGLSVAPWPVEFSKK